MSTLRADLIQNAAANNRPAVTKGDFVSTWINMNGTGTIATRDSFNVSSIVDNSLGDFSLNYTNSFSNANYSMGGAVGNDEVNPGTIQMRSFAAAPTTSASRYLTMGASVGDISRNHLVIAGTLA